MKNHPGRFIFLTALAALSAVFLIFAPPTRAAEPPEDAKFIPIERIVTEGRVNRTPYFAYVSVRGDIADVWVPAELLADMNCPVRLSADKTFFTARVENPADKFGLPELRNLIPNAVIDINFRAVGDGERYYFNITGMEAVTGITSTTTDGRRVIGPPASGEILIVGYPALMPEKAKVVIPEFKPRDLGTSFSLIWDHVTRHNPDISAEDVLPTVKVISPTWFDLADDSGTITNKADWSYTVGAHEKGYEVWALVSNGFNRERTTKFLANQATQNEFIARMLVYAKLYGADGINIDFENLANGDASRFTAFVKQFSEYGRRAGLKMSVDLPVPSDWNRAFEFAALSDAVDYVAIMTYDEHWGTSPRAGSTASLPWVDTAIQRTLTQIPPEKILMGIPFYTREWAETRNNDGRVSVRARTMAMVSVDVRLEETGASLQWLGDVGQNYFQYASDGRTYRIWVENERSIALRMALINRYKLAGAAFWRKGFEKPEVWQVIQEAMSGNN